MYPLGHAGITLLLYAPVASVLVRHDRRRTMAVGLLVLLSVTLLPDLDVLVPGLPHRGPTHSIAAAACLGIVAGVVGWASGSLTPRRRPERAAMGLFVGLVGVVSHLIGDVITPMGIDPFYPVFSSRLTLNLVSARDPAANVMLFAAGLVVFELALFSVWSQPVTAGRSTERSSIDSDTAPR